MSVPDEFKLFCEVEELIWQCTEESIEKAKEYIPKLDNLYLQNLAICAAQHTYIHYSKFARFFMAIPRTGMRMNPLLPFAQMLYTKGLIRAEDFEKSVKTPEKFNDEELSFYEDPIKEDTILSAVLHDDLNMFSNQLAHNEIDIINQTFKLPTSQMSLIKFASFVGAINILKFLVVNSVEVRDDVLEWVIAGGHEPIIEFLASKGHSFDRKLIFAVGYHHNKIAYWLIDNYRCENIKMPMCVHFFNTEIFFFLLQRGRSVDETEIADKTSLILAVQMNYIPLIQLLIDNGANPMILDAYDYPALHYAHTQEVKQKLTQASQAYRKNTGFSIFKSTDDN